MSSNNLKNSPNLLQLLLDKYERGSAFGKIDQWKRDITIKLDEKTFPSEWSANDSDAREALLDAARELGKLRIARVFERKGFALGTPYEVRLGPKELNAAYDAAMQMGYTPLHVVLDELCSWLTPHSFGEVPPWMSEFIANTTKLLQDGDTAALGCSRAALKASLQEYKDAFMAAAALSHNSEATTERVFSERLFRDSKRFVAIRSRVKYLLESADPHWKTTVSPPIDTFFEHYGVRSKPRFLFCAGGIAYSAPRGQRSLLDESPAAAIAERLVPALANAIADAGPITITTIENETPYYLYIDERGGPTGLLANNEIVVYTGGFPSDLVIAFLKRCAEGEDVFFRHWPDGDAAGLRIWWTIRKSIQRPVRIFRMRKSWIDDLAKYETHRFTDKERSELIETKRFFEAQACTDEDLLDAVALLDALCTREIVIEQEHHYSCVRSAAPRTDTIPGKAYFDAKDFSLLYRPSECELRIVIANKQGIPDTRTELQLLLAKLKKQVELEYLDTFSPQSVVDLSGLQPHDRLVATDNAVRTRAEVIFKPLLRTEITLGAKTCVVTGQPDFLVRERDRYVIRDAVIARHINRASHPEVIYSMQLCGWLYQHSFGQAPAKLELLGPGNARKSVFDDTEGGDVLKELRKIVELCELNDNPYSPVGWTKCKGCQFISYCWTNARQQQDVAILPEVNQELALSLRRVGCRSITNLLDAFTPDSLAAFQYRPGTEVGDRAPHILTSAKSFRANSHIVRNIPDLPQSSAYGVLDLEGVPPLLGDSERIFLWGLRIVNPDNDLYIQETADVPEADEHAWRQFLQRYAAQKEGLPPMPVLHWHHYERTMIEKYVARCGDWNGVAEQLLASLVDLLPIFREAVTLPVYSYSLKEVEKYVGFERQILLSGDAAVAKYVEATTLTDRAERTAILEQIEYYNREDIDSLWAVFLWLRGLSRGCPQ
jgi:predicted RecB family nuclease